MICTVDALPAELQFRLESNVVPRARVPSGRMHACAVTPLIPEEQEILFSCQWITPEPSFFAACQAWKQTGVKNKHTAAFY